MDGNLDGGRETAESSSARNGVLQLIGSPIGNLEDITLRAISCLKSADLIACEDTRHSRRLLNHLEISPKELVSLHDHNESSKAQWIAGRAAAGETVALLSDAGMPTVSDPGFRLVNACIDSGVTVEVIPGPSAVLTGLAGSGLPTDSFYFGGFLPVKSGKKTKELEAALSRRETSIYFESPHRIGRTLHALAELRPDRRVCVARELTKRFETYHRGTALDLADEFGAKSAKGEITLLIQGISRKEKPAKE